MNPALSEALRLANGADGETTAPDGSVDKAPVLRQPLPPRSAPQSLEWPTMDQAAYYGLAGDVVRTIEPHSEADPVALLVQFLTMAGNVIGRAPHYRVESDRHGGNLFAVLVGESSKARKGTSASRVRAVVKVSDRNLGR